MDIDNYNFAGGAIDTCDSYNPNYDQDSLVGSGVPPDTLNWNSSIEYGTIMSYCQFAPNSGNMVFEIFRKSIMRGQFRKIDTQNKGYGATNL